MSTISSRGHHDLGDISEPSPLPVPRPEYPRPDRDRSHRWVNLNGQWGFEAAAEFEAPSAITVPFAWETSASGVARIWLERATYRRTVLVPESWSGARVVLCFGAVHHAAIVTIDGREVGTHVGGYEYFEFDVTEHLEPGRASQLSVQVTAPADKREIAHGKQRSIPRDDYDGVSFTPTSGIWQTVWLEARGRTYASTVALRGDSLTGFDIVVQLAGDSPASAPIRARLLETGQEIELTPTAEGHAEGRLEIDDPQLWSPEDPNLYRVEIVTGGTAGAVHNGAEADVDRVVVTGGLRRIETRGEELYLNGTRFSIRGVLDQGYWPVTGLTAPTAQALVTDIAWAHALGYNLVRKHLKFEEPQWLHEADRTGMLVWAEPACPSRFSPAAAAAFEAQLPSMVERDGNHPAIIVWGLYNEEWGLDWDIPGSPEKAEAAVRAYDLLHDLDDTRPIVENSGWAHVRTDLVDWHYYEPDLATWKRRLADLASGDRSDFPVRLGADFVVDKDFYANDDVPRTGLPIVNSEYGEGFTSLERAWHLRWETQELRRHDRFAGYVYTEFADVEHEAAGLLTTDRRAKDWGGCIPAEMNAETVLVLDMVPLRAGADLAPFTDDLHLDVHVSHHGARPITASVQAHWLPAGAPLSRHGALVASSDAVEVQPFVLSDSVTLVVPPPPGTEATDTGTAPGTGRLVITACDGSGAQLARTFVDVAPVEPPNRRGARPE